MKTNIGVLDDGFSRSLIHSERVLSFKDFGSPGSSHGDLVSQAILSVDPECEMTLAGACLDSWDRVLEALRWISRQGIDCLNLSWACSSLPPEASSILRSLEERGIPVFCSFSRDLPLPWSLCHSVGGGPEGVMAPSSLPWLKRKGTSISTGIVSGAYSLWRKRRDYGDLHEFLSSWSPESMSLFPSVNYGIEQKNLDL